MDIGKTKMHSMSDGALMGGGEMGALMRAVDWSVTPLGPVVEWPQSLRTAVSICLASRFPMLIWWGPDLVMLYNDAYRPMLGAMKHPAAMGQRGAACWSEIWNIIGPMLTGVLTHGEATWSEDQLLLLDRNGYVEECYFTFSYSAIRDESGGIGGVFTAVTETTERVLGERRLRTLRALADASVTAETVDDACQQVMDALAQNPADVPFALLYLIEGEGASARLTGTTNIARGTPASPTLVMLDKPTDDRLAWPLADVAHSSMPVEVADVRQRFGELLGGQWEILPNTALILPIPTATQEQLAGLIVFGINPRHALDAAYRDFCSLIAGQIATIIGNARANEEARRHAAALAALDRAKTDFFGNVSHEFRTPLTLMLGPLADALTDFEQTLPPVQRQRLEMVERNGLRLQRLVNTLLDFSRIEAGRVDATYEPMDLAVYTAELASLFRSAFERAGLHFIVDCPPLPMPVYVNREMWEKIVLNLLSNALKFTFTGEIAVRLLADTDDRHVTLTISDTGTGIPSGELPHLFERFHRVRGTRARTLEGSGIGLALVRELITIHAGSVSVESTVGEGTVFTVTMPTGTAHLAPECITVAHSRAATATTTGSATHIAEALRWLPDDRDELTVGKATGEATEKDTASGMVVGARILLADDNADMLAYISQILREQFSVETYPNGQTVLDAAHANPPDLILTDVMMPGLDGFALLRALRNDPQTRNVPVILLSARAGEDSAIEGLNAGANDYIVKPFSGRELVARVSATLATAQLRRETVRVEQTARVEAEAERERLYAFLLQAPVAIAIFRGPQYLVEFANPRVCEIWGRTRAQMLGKFLFDALPESSAQGFETLLDGVLATGVPYIGTELPSILNRNGRRDIVYWNFVFEPIHERDGTIERVMVVATDVSEQVSMRDAVERERQQFTAMIAHELRNPLSSLLGYAQLMKRRERYDAKAVETIIAQGNRLERLTRDLRETVRVQRGLLSLERASVDVRALIVAAVEQAQVAAPTYTLSLDVPAHLPTAWWDADRIEQVLSNLILNSIKYSEPDGEVQIIVEDCETAVRIRVADLGIGIPPEALPHIFGSFYRAHNAQSGSARGMGLGLPISKALIEAHDGELTVESRIGEGSTFTLSLPYGAPLP